MMDPVEILCSQCHRQVLLQEEMLGKGSVCPHCGQRMVVAMHSQNIPDVSGREVYNIVSDTVTGVNIRRRDNLWQLAAIGIGLLLGITIGVLFVQDRILGAVAGGFIGMMVGLFGSGLFLMIYRFVCHVREHHQ